MPDRSIFEVEIDDREFRDFAELFGKYQAALKSTPAAWGNVVAQVERVGSGVERARRSSTDQRSSSSEISKFLDKIALEAVTSVVMWGRVTRHGRQFLVDVVRSTQSVVRWSTITTALGSLLGAGGMWGINRMAQGVAERRTGALGLGTTYGEYNAAATNFARLGDSEALLRGFGAALTDVRRQAPLVGLMGSEWTRRMGALGPAEALADALPRIKDLVDRTDPRLLGPVLRARGLEQLGIDVYTANVIRGMSREEVEDLVKRYRQDVDPLGVSAIATRRWQEFSTQMTRAGVRIQNVLAGNLVGLLPGMTHLSEAMTGFFGKLLKPGGLVAEWIEATGRGLDRFARYVGTPDFVGKVDQFVRNAHGLVDLFSRFSTAARDPSSGLFGQAPGSPGQARANRWFNWMFGRTSQQRRSEDDRTTDGRPVPPGLLGQAEALLRGGKSSGDLQKFMADQGYPMSGAWCGQFAASVVRAGGGVPPDNASVASNWLRWGQHVDPGDVRPGDVAVSRFSRYGGPAIYGRTGSHVGLVSSVDRNVGVFGLLAGNQGRPVSNRPMSAFEFRRPRPLPEGTIPRAEASPDGGQRTRQSLAPPPIFTNPQLMGRTSSISIQDNSGGALSVTGPSLGAGRIDLSRGTSFGGAR